jgi:hypothetical protein
MKHKTGDKVKIIDNTCSHQFKLGEIVEISSVNDERLEYFASSDDGAYWFLKEADCEAVVEKSAPPPEIKVLGIKSIQTSLITESHKWVTVEEEEAEGGLIETYVTFKLKEPKVRLKVELTIDGGIVGGCYIDEYHNNYTCLSLGSAYSLDIDGKDYKAPEELVLISLAHKEGSL